MRQEQNGIDQTQIEKETCILYNKDQWPIQFNNYYGVA